MKYILSLLLLINFAYAGEHDYSIIIDEPFNNALLDVTQDYDRSISAIGFIKKYKKSNVPSNATFTNAFDYLASVSSSYGSQMHIIKLDKNSADIEFRETAKLTRFNEAIAVVKTPQNGYFVGGYTLDGELILARLDSGGNLVRKVIFGTKNYDRMNNLILLSDGGVLSVGSSITSRSPHDDMFETGLGLKDIYLTRFSKDGQKLWSKKYGTLYDDRGIDAVEARDGSIIVISQTNYNKFKNVTLMRITENGDTVWLRHYKSEKMITPHKVIRLRDGNFLASLTEQNEMHKQEVRLVKFDIQKNLINDKIIHTNYSSFLLDIKEYSNSTIIGVGHVQDKFDTDGLAMVFDSNLELIAQEHYGDGNYDSFKAVTILNNSQAAVVGVNTANDSQESNMWILKLNTDLSIAQISNRAIDFYEELLKIFAYEINSHQIKIKKDLSIEFLNKELYFAQSEYELNKKQKEFLNKFANKLLPFMYKYQDMIDSFEIDGHTSSEWGHISFSQRYLKNEELSMKRSFSTISYIFNKQDEKMQKFLSKVIKGSGLNFSEKKLTFYNKEDREKSRRVSFKIILK
jgi:outer membrane protein OmpA-like peptidoglycan-associated protein